MDGVESINASVPQEVTSSVSSSPKKRPFSSGFLVGLFLFLVICLIAALTYYVLKDNGVELFSTKTENTSTTGDSSTTADSSSSSTTTNTTTCSDSDKDCKVAVTNSGWALFSLPEYDFSVEIPNYWPKINLGGEQVDYKWAYKPYVATDSQTTDVLSDYQNSVDISFMPSYIPESVACGGFCVKQHEMTVNIYRNDSHSTLAQISALYLTNWNKLNGDEVISLKSTGTSSKWGRDVATYSKNYVETSMDVYLVVTNSYVYEVSYHISSDPSESQTVGQKVLDSMKFEDASPSGNANNVTVDVTYEGSGSSISSDYSNMVYFEGQGDTDSTSRVYLIASSNVSLGTSQVGKKFSLTYDSSMTTGNGVAAGTEYITLNGAFSYEAK